MHGSAQTLSFESNVSGVHISGPSVSCVTPCEISVKRNGVPLSLTAQESQTDRSRRYILSDYTHIRREFYQKEPGEYLTELSLFKKNGEKATIYFFLRTKR